MPTAARSTTHPVSGGPRKQRKSPNSPLPPTLLPEVASSRTPPPPVLEPQTAFDSAEVNHESFTHDIQPFTFISNMLQSFLNM